MKYVCVRREVSLDCHTPACWRNWKQGQIIWDMYTTRYWSWIDPSAGLVSVESAPFHFKNNGVSSVARFNNWHTNKLYKLGGHEFISSCPLSSSLAATIKRNPEVPASYHSLFLRWPREMPNIAFRLRITLWRRTGGIVESMRSRPRQ
jgi:hypothetical protein